MSHHPSPGPTPQHLPAVTLPILPAEPNAVPLSLADCISPYQGPSHWDSLLLILCWFCVFCVMKLLKRLHVLWRFFLEAGQPQRLWKALHDATSLWLTASSLYETIPNQRPQQTLSMVLIAIQMIPCKCLLRISFPLSTDCDVGTAMADILAL